MEKHRTVFDGTRWPTTSLLIIGIFAAVGLVLLLFLGRRTDTNFGFGPEWQCTPMPKGDPICVKLVGKDGAK
ncbi:hypothetical protein [Mesorhizobium sp. L2C066B000]|uniref:hypothetical protein n=1 Tax=Mesorhizobium sp. L2C066B000 TaxID=1287105 RepID=UPI0003CFB96A|nr:hypothetical protein [Mesorhizobium sp. L2C066B000]ESZ38205.1 hypothetical protein X732_20310 [Mesorhizobium sp. L2C066B000]